MIYLFIIIFAVMVVFIIYSKKYINPYKLILHIGRKGSGKTCNIVKSAYKYHKQGKRVYCTERNIPYTIYIPYDYIGKYWFEDDGKTVILIDEVGLIWHCRSYADKAYNTYFKSVREWFKYQRHNKVIVECYSQSLDVDKNLRDLCDEVYIHTSFLTLWSKARRVGRRIVLSAPKTDGSGASDTITEEYYYMPLLASKAVSFTFIPRWCKGYDSFSALPLPPLPHEEISDNVPRGTFGKNCENVAQEK